MTFTTIFLIIFLALLLVLAMRGDISNFIPVIWNWLRGIKYNLGSTYNTYYGMRPPTDPDPSQQFINLPRHNVGIV
tara:strand:+ start:463 stop:690 length:228 start_codon:yes stop_codon:yes gene_type:complete